MKKHLAAASVVAALVAVFLLAAPAGAHHSTDHDGGEPSAADAHRANDSKPEDGGGNKAETSDDGEKPFDAEPNDHPSGKDKSEEPGGSTTQGKSQSDPDGLANGGADKPGGSGGFDDDKDGNNGCGNDDDFEDDNNGWCGKPVDEEVAADEVFDADAAPWSPGGVSTMGDVADDSVLGAHAADAAPIEVSDEVPDEVLGTRMSRGSTDVDAVGTVVNPALLPFTGLGSMPVVILVAIAVALVGAGTMAARRARI